MDKEELKKRLKSCEDLKEAHLQDACEISFVIEGLKKQLKEYKENAPVYTG